MKRLAAALGFSVLVGAIASCSYRPSSSARIQIQGQLPKMRAAGRVAYDGYVVNVSGPGISPTVSSAGIGDYAPDCVEVGVSSNVLSYDTLSTEGVLLKVAAGPNRKIQIFGITSSLGSEILGKPISHLFENRVPQLFSLAKAEGVSLFQDRRVDLTASTSDPKPANVLRNCFSSDLPVEAIPPAQISQMRILAISQNTTAGINNVKLDLDTGAFSAGETVDLAQLGLSAQMSPDLTSALIWDPNGGYNQTFAILSNGNLDLQGAGSQTPFVGALGAIFRGDSQLGFTTRTGPDLGVFALRRGVYTEGSPTSLNLDPDRQLLIYGGNLYRIRREVVSVIVESTGLSTALASSTSPADFTTRYNTQTSSDTAANSVVNSRGIYLVYSMAKPVVRFLRHTDGTGGLAGDLGATPELGNSLSAIKMVVSPDGKFLFVRVSDTGLKIRCYKLNPDGSVPSTHASEISANYATDFVVEPTSRYLILGNTNGGLSGLESYRFDSNGIISIPPKTFSSLSANLQKVLAFPVR